MAALGGYFAVTYLAEHVLTDGLDAAWRVKYREAAAAASWSNPTPVGLLALDGAVSLDKPSLSFNSAANAIRVSLTGGARCSLTLDGNAAGGVFIAVAADIDVPIEVTQEQAYKQAVVDMTGILLQKTDLHLTWFDAPPDGRSEAAVLSQETRQALTAEFVKRASRYLTFRLPMDKVFMAELAMMTQGVPGSVILTPQIKLGGVKVLDDWLALGVDATSGVGATHGDASQIGPPPDAPPPAVHGGMPAEEGGDDSLRLLVDPGVLKTYLIANAKMALVIARGQHPSIHPADDIGVRFENDTLVVNAHGNVDRPDPFPGTMPFTAELRVRPFVAKNTRTVYASVSPDVRVDADWYLEVIGAIFDFFGADVFAKLRRANKGEVAVLFGVKAETKVPDLADITARIEGRRIVLRDDLVGIYGEARITSHWSEAPVDRTPSVYVGVRIRDRYLQLRLDHGNRLKDDPTYRIRYRVMRGSDGAEVDRGVTWAGAAPFGTPVDLWDPANYLETQFSVELVAERPPGHEVGRNTQAFPVVDLFDRSHPYARWRKTHFYTENRKSIRLSAVHRTGIHERCKFCDTGTERVRATYEVQALDAVPPPNVEGFSDRLCPYCFPPG